MSLGRENDVCQIGMAVAGLCLDFFFAVSSAAWHTVPENMFFWVGKLIFLNWRVAVAGISSFAVSTAVWQIAAQKMMFGSGKSFFLNWRLAIAGICWDFFFCGVRAKHDFWVGKITFLKRLLGFAGISSFAVSILLLARLPGKESGGYWDLLRFLLLRCPGKK